jgi:hypothetical protein
MELARFAVLAAAATLALAATGCSGTSDDRVQPAARPADDPRPAPVTSAERASAAEPARPAPVRPTSTTAGPARDPLPADFPAECAAYAELIEKLKACDRLAGARAGLSQAYFDLRAAWPTVPAERRDDLARQCKVQGDSLRSAAAATCGW